MNDKQYAKSVISSLISNIVRDVDGGANEHDHIGSVREYLWPNPNEKILLTSHSKHPLNSSNPLPPMEFGRATKLTFETIFPTELPPKGKYYAIFGSEKRTSTSVMLLMNDEGYAQMIYEGQARNDEKITCYTKKTGQSLSVQHRYEQFPLPLDGGRYEVTIFPKGNGQRRFEYILHDDVFGDDCIPWQQPIWDFKIRNSTPYEDVLYLPIDDGWSEFPLLSDDRNLSDSNDKPRPAITRKTMAADWAGIDHNNERAWQNFITVGRDGDYYGYDNGWTSEAHTLGRLKNETSPEGYKVDALYQKGTDGKNVYIESVDAWQEKINVFTLNLEPKNERLIFHRVIDNTIADGLYKMVDFGRVTDLDKTVGELRGLIFHGKVFAVPESDKPVYFWQREKSGVVCAPNADGHPEERNMPSFYKRYGSWMTLDVCVPTIPPKTGKTLVILGVKGQGTSSMPLGIREKDGRYEWDFRNQHVTSTAHENFTLTVDGVPKAHGDEVDISQKGKFLKLRLEPVRDRGYFMYFGRDLAGYSKFDDYLDPIINIARGDDDNGTFQFCTMKDGFTNAPYSPDLTGNGWHIYYRNVEQNDFAPMLDGGTKDEANAGKA